MQVRRSIKTQLGGKLGLKVSVVLVFNHRFAVQIDYFTLEGAIGPKDGGGAFAFENYANW